MLSGIYRGVITNAADPSGLNRLYVSIPVLTGTNSVWAFPCLTGPMPTVKPGDGVWISFEGGDIAFPVWMGFFGGVTDFVVAKHTHPRVSSSRWNYIDTLAMSNPSAGNIRGNTPPGTLTTALAISKNSATNDMTDVLAALVEGDQLLVEEDANWVRFKVSGPILNYTMWFQIPVVQMAVGGTELVRNDDVLITFTYGRSA